MSLLLAKSVVYNWCVNELADVQWSFEEQNSPNFKLSSNPNGIGKIKLLSVGAARGRLDFDYEAGTDDFKESYNAMKILTFSINIFGDESFFQCDRLKSSAVFSENWELFSRNKIGFIDTTGTRDITALISAQFEPRAQFDIRFYTTIEYTKRVDRMVKFRLMGDYDNGRLLTNEEINL